MGLFRDAYFYYTIIIWFIVFVMFRRNPGRIKELLPVAIVGFGVQFLIEEFLVTAGLYQFKNIVLPVFGVPLFNILWAGAGAIILMYFMPQKGSKRFLVLLIFTVIFVALEYIPEHTGKAENLGKFTHIHDTIQNYSSLITLVFLSETIFCKRINKKSSYKDDKKDYIKPEED